MDRIIISRMVSTHQPAGEYKPTAIDAARYHVDFCLTSVSVKSNTIRWSDGRVQNVTDRQLSKLQASHTWATEF